MHPSHIAAVEAIQAGEESSILTLRLGNAGQEKVRTRRSDSQPLELWLRGTDRKVRRLSDKEILFATETPEMRREIVEIYTALLSGAGTLPMGALGHVHDAYEETLRRMDASSSGAAAFHAARRLIATKDVSAARRLAASIGEADDMVHASPADAARSIAKGIARINSGMPDVQRAERALSSRDRVRLAQLSMLAEAARRLSPPERAKVANYGLSVHRLDAQLARSRRSDLPAPEALQNSTSQHPPLSNAETADLGKILSELGKSQEMLSTRRLALVESAGRGRLNVFTEEGPINDLVVAPRDDGQTRKAHSAALIWLEASSRGSGFSTVVEATDPVDAKEFAELSGSEDGRMRLQAVAREAAMHAQRADVLFERLGAQVEDLVLAHSKDAEALHKHAEREAGKFSASKLLDIRRDAISAKLATKDPDQWDWTDLVTTDEIGKAPLRDDQAAFIEARGAFLQQTADLDRSHDLLSRRLPEAQRRLATTSGALINTAEGLASLAVGAQGGFTASGRSAESTLDTLSAVERDAADALTKVEAARTIWAGVDGELAQIEATGLQERIAARLAMHVASENSGEIIWGHLVECTDKVAADGTHYLSIDLETAQGRQQAVLFGKAAEEFGDAREDLFVRARLGGQTGLGLPALDMLEVPSTKQVADAIAAKELDREDAITALRRGLRRENAHGILVFGRTVQSDVRASSRELISESRMALERDPDALVRVKALGDTISNIEPDFRTKATYMEKLRGIPAPAFRLDAQVRQLQALSQGLRMDLRSLAETSAASVSVRDGIEARLKAEISVLDLYREAARSVALEEDGPGHVAEQGMVSTRKADLGERSISLYASETAARSAMAANARAGAHDTQLSNSVIAAVDVVLPTADVALIQISRARAGDADTQGVFEALEKARLGLQRFSGAVKDAEPSAQPSASRPTRAIDAEIDAAIELTQASSLQIGGALAWIDNRGLTLAAPAGGGVRVAHMKGEMIEVRNLSDWTAVRDDVEGKARKISPDERAGLADVMAKMVSAGFDPFDVGNLADATARAHQVVSASKAMTGAREITFLGTSQFSPKDPGQAAAFAVALADIAASEGAHGNELINARVSGAILVSRRRAMEALQDGTTPGRIAAIASGLGAAARFDPDNAELKATETLARTAQRAAGAREERASTMSEDAVSKERQAHGLIC